ncbi:MAG: transcriptional regulator [Opitutae bacterium]|nr:transcriptional regulator [Opitutae bacterium]|tara:strand:- start:1893 stop:2822 length:930 start_codon:yes stop_codon:yes gene_type:complete
MPDPWEILKALADPTRLRIIHLLDKGEFSVAEMQEILGMGQSRISSHLANLRKGELVQDRKEGKKTYYRRKEGAEVEQNIVKAALTAFAEQPESQSDLVSLKRALDKRRRATENYFNAVAGRLGKNYCPGRSWEAIGHLLLRLAPPIVIADLGAGEGMVAQLLAPAAKKVHCIDNSRSMVEIGTKLAKKNGLTNLSYKYGDIEKVPLGDASIDLALMSQSLHHAQRPEIALREAYRILKPSGKILILDLKEHGFEKARTLYADRWLGFAENDLYGMVRDAGFKGISVSVVAREEKEPCFETLLAAAEKG